MGTKKGFKSIFGQKSKKTNQETIPSMEEAIKSKDIEVDNDGNIQVSFKTEPGIGRGINRVPHSRMAEYLQVLEGFVENPPTEESRDCDVIEVVKNTAALNDGVISHSWEYGKGKKPLKILQSELPQLISFLKECNEEIVAYLDGNMDEDEDDDSLEEDSLEEDLEDDLEEDSFEDDLE